MPLCSSQATRHSMILLGSSFAPCTTALANASSRESSMASSLLSAPVEFFDKTAGVAPSWLGFHVEFEEDFAPHHPFDLNARGGADFLQHQPTFADQNSLLAIALAVDGCRDARESRTFLEAVD